MLGKLQLGIAREWWSEWLHCMDESADREGVAVNESEASLVEMESCMVASLEAYGDEAECLEEGAESLRKIWGSSVSGDV